MADAKSTTSAQADEFFHGPARETLGAKLTDALAICDLPAGATPAQKWEAFVTLALCDRRILATLQRCSRDTAQKLARRSRKPTVREAASAAENSKSQGRPKAPRPKSTWQQNAALAREFERFKGKGFHGDEAAVHAFLRSPAAKKFGLTVNGHTLSAATVLKRVRSGKRLRASGGFRRYPGIASALSASVPTPWSFGLLRRLPPPRLSFQEKSLLREIARTDPANRIAKRRVDELASMRKRAATGELLREQGMLEAIRIALATAK